MYWLIVTVSILSVHSRCVCSSSELVGASAMPGCLDNTMNQRPNPAIHGMHSILILHLMCHEHRSSSRTSGVSSLAITPRKPGEHALWRSEGGGGGGAAGKDGSSVAGTGKGGEAAAPAPKSELWRLWAALG
jgi:hypothetical protein